MTATSISYEFVESMPRALKADVLYVSIDFRTTMHLCACGCGNEVVLPLRPTAWSLTYDGETTSLSPSVGNWSFPCRSHYWIRRGRIDWASAWSDEQVDAGRQRTLVDRGAIPATNVGYDPSPAGWSRRLVAAVRRRL